MPIYKSIKEMKKVLVLGVCALFIACSSSPEKVNATDTTAVLVADTSSLSVPSVDTTTVSPVNTVVATPEKTESKVAQPKPKVAPAVKESKVVVKDPVVADNADVKKGESLISKSDCFACHKLNEKLLGPSYHDVAAKYENTKANVDMLVNKIKVGGSGVWGAIPMSPHPALSDDDIRSMVQYVLSLK